MKREKTLKRDLCLIDFLRQHKEMRNVVSSKEICDNLNRKGFAYKSDSMYSQISNIKRAYRLPILYIPNRGYFWAENADEITFVINDLKSRISEMTDHIKLLEGFIVK